MVKDTIKIFCRVKPTKGKLAIYDVEEKEDADIISFNLPKESVEWMVNNKKENYKFQFQSAFDQKTRQDDIFEHVAQPVIDNVLQGYNGTIFAYGQTGSGKTYTMTGGAERYADRGIIPRTLSYIFDYYSKNPDSVYATSVSYLEIYNENGYDLLDPKHEATKLEDLPKVSLHEDSEQNIHLKNLALYPAASEEDALNLLFVGDTNRMIAETPMNQASTRSHCIFTIHLTVREAGSATVRRAKLHLVDLAGSERVSKTGVNGQLLTEAKYINLSLHYLEQVIVALSEAGRTHIPYRNSMMTSVLRDSLGGNCMTTMIATISIEKKNIDESISTCRFAQRVAMIKNDAILNEELDPKLMIQKLKREIQQLKDQISMTNGDQSTLDLSNEEISECEKLVCEFLQDNNPESMIDVGADLRKVHECFRIIKRKFNEKASVRSITPASSDVSTIREKEDNFNSNEFGRIKDLLQQRDNEINILVNMLKKEKKRVKNATSELKKAGIQPPPTPKQDSTFDSQNGFYSDSTPPSTTQSDNFSQKAVGPIKMKKQDETRQKKILNEMSIGRQEAFDTFRREYKLNHVLEQHKAELKSLYSQAKELGNEVNTSRQQINALKSKLERERVRVAMTDDQDSLEEEIKCNLDSAKTSYKERFNLLKHLKAEIEHTQHLLDSSKMKLLKDFEIWWAEQAALNQRKQEDSDLIQRNSRKVDSSYDNLGKTGWSTPHKVEKSTVPADIPLTGDPQADADIIAFMEARRKALSRQGKR
ncbi:DgyrCDS7671 [Dimorphilus gyrociliatus]|uniref:Kinesin-like protein n=1 Tax=Dimorphilus gyrociliatus TaxID=2664684 RepID=A0A7I8VRU7_9ANNE|nr:DgyrCDS7671 [Dimorphilus gyrociliatus]